MTQAERIEYLRLMLIDWLCFSRFVDEMDGRG